MNKRLNPFNNSSSDDELHTVFHPKKTEFSVKVLSFLWSHMTLQEGTDVTPWAGAESIRDACVFSILLWFENCWA